MSDYKEEEYSNYENDEENVENDKGIYNDSNENNLESKYNNDYGNDDDDDDDDDELSDLDEEQFKDMNISSIGKVAGEDHMEEVFTLSRHKKADSVELPDLPETQDEQGLSDVSKYSEKKRKRIQVRGERIDRNDREFDEQVDNEMKPLDPEIIRRKELEARLDNAVKRTSNHRKRKIDEVDLETLQDEKMSQLRNKMREAAFADQEAIREKKPATHKLHLLPEVKEMFQKQGLYDSILDNNLLEAIRLWLEPLPDGSVPAYSIQNALFEVIRRLPIKTIHLRESGLGRIVIFYRKTLKTSKKIQKLANDLIDCWSRPIMGKSDNYRDRKVATADYDELAARHAQSIKIKNDRVSNSGNRVENGRARYRAVIPSVSTSTYEVAPKSRGTISINNTQKGSNYANDEQFKRIRQKMFGVRSKTKKSGVSIEGRGLN